MRPSEMKNCLKIGSSGGRVLSYNKLMKLRVIFLGTPEFAIPSLKALLADHDIDVVGVMTQPDRPAGRGHKLTPPPVKVLAEEYGLQVRQPARLRKEPEMIDWLKAHQPDYLVTAAFGQILPQTVLDIPKYGTVNVHASLLPRYRGANPVQWSIINGDAKTGVTTMFTELAVDSGPMLLQAETAIDPNENALALTQRLAQLGAEILPKSLHQFASGDLKSVAQDVSQVTHASKLTKEDAFIDWSMPAQTIHDKIRGQQPWPGAVTQIGEIQLKVIQTRSPQTGLVTQSVQKSGRPGDILAILDEGLVVQTGSGPLLLEMIQPPGKPKMAARDWANGALRQIPEQRFTTLVQGETG